MAYRDKNDPRKSAKQRQWKKENPDKVRASNARSKMKHRAAARAAMARDRARKPEYYRNLWRQGGKRYRNIVRTFINSYKATHPCVGALPNGDICGESDPIVLDFHHRDPSTKLFTIGEVTQSGRRLATLKEEIAKCDVLCANCHRRQTAAKRPLLTKPQLPRLEISPQLALFD